LTKYFEYLCLAASIAIETAKCVLLTPRNHSLWRLEKNIWNDKI